MQFWWGDFQLVVESRARRGGVRPPQIGALPPRRQPLPTSVDVSQLLMWVSCRVVSCRLPANSQLWLWSASFLPVLLIALQLSRDTEVKPPRVNHPELHAFSYCLAVILKINASLMKLKMWNAIMFAFILWNCPLLASKLRIVVKTTECWLLQPRNQT